MDLQKHAKEVLDQGYTVIAYPTDFVVDLMHAYNCFLERPWKSDRALWGKYEGVGHVDYRAWPKKGKDNNKAYIHYSERLRTLLHDRGVNNPYYTIGCMDPDTLLDSLKRMHTASIDVGGNIIREIARQLPNSDGDRLDDGFDKATQRQKHISRALDYEPLQGDSRGNAHTDKCGFTIHWASSGPLLIHRHDDGEFLYQPEENKVVFFRSDRFQYFTGGKLIAGEATDDVRNKVISGGYPAMLHEPYAGDTVWNQYYPEGRRFAAASFLHID